MLKNSMAVAEAHAPAVTENGSKTDIIDAQQFQMQVGMCTRASTATPNLRGPSSQCIKAAVHAVHMNITADSQVFGHLTGAMTASLIGLGDRLGFYKMLEKLGKATSAELAAASGTHERFTREWLHQQVHDRLIIP
jgi:hypothetical protein